MRHRLFARPGLLPPVHILKNTLLYYMFSTSDYQSECIPALPYIIPEGMASGLIQSLTEREVGRDKNIIDMFL